MIYPTNTATVIGRLPEDPKQEVTKNGKAFVKTSIATDDGKDAQGNKVTQWLTIRIYGQPAEFLAKYCRKGDLIAVNGKNKRDRWKDANGRTVSEQYIQAESVVKLATSPKQPVTDATANTADNSRPEFDSGAYNAVTPDDLPF